MLVINDSYDKILQVKHSGIRIIYEAVKDRETIPIIF